ncbi:MAG TPA: sigma-70 family RNA polymerase sigma factor [Ktedonobacterales bacterium]|jgi:RNA polymerase sigma-70 factor (ECF subfamily)
MAQDGSLDEQQLIQGLRERDPRTLEALITQYSHELFYLARLILAGAGSPQDAEECVNDLFVTVWQEFDSYDPARGSLRTWLTMRTRYIVLDRRRKLMRQNPADSLVASLHEEYTLAALSDGVESERRPTNLPMTAGIDTLLEEREQRQAMYTALENLPELERLMVYLRYFKLASVDEIASRVGLTKHAVDTRLWRVRKSLTKVLQEQVYDPSLKTTK